MTRPDSTRRVLRPLLATALALLAGSVGRAHPEIDDALARLNAQLAAAPGDAALYLERGELYARHEDWVAAEANYLRAAELSPDLPRLNTLRGALALATGNPLEARLHLNRALRQTPDDVESLILRARAHVALHSTEAAQLDYAAALARAAAPAPELFLEQASVLPAEAAIRSLDEAIARLGPVVTLQLKALALEESLGRIDAAAARLDQLAARSERKEDWLKRRGDLFARAGRGAEAAAAYSAALAAIAALPEWLRASPESQKLGATLAELVARRP
jgi:predicted Zn-dependent protease